MKPRILFQVFYIFLITLFVGVIPAQAQWTQIGQDIDGEAAGDRSGVISLSADGSVVAIGAGFNDGTADDAGHVRVYQNIDGTWVQVGEDIDGEGINDESGGIQGVSLNSEGSIVAIGARLNDGNGPNSGHVRVYEYIGGAWTQIGQDINGDSQEDYSGQAVSINSDGTALAVGAPRDGPGNAGSVKVFRNNSGTWTQEGQTIDGEFDWDESGSTVSLSSDGSVVAIGAYLNDGNGVDSGHVRVFEYTGGTWTQVGEDIDGEAAGDYSGRAISLSSDGSILAIGARFNDGNGTDSGHARIFENIGGEWIQLGQDIDGEAAADRFGFSISLSSDGSIVAIGATLNDGNGTDSGSVRIFQFIGGMWVQIDQDIYGEATDDRFGFKVSLSADGYVVAIGANRNDGNGVDSGHVRVFEDEVLGISELSSNRISIFPNPVKDNLNIWAEETINAVSIVTILGQELYTSNVDALNTTLDLSGYGIGTYFVKVWFADSLITKKIIKE